MIDENEEVIKKAQIESENSDEAEEPKNYFDSSYHFISGLGESEDDYGAESYP